jgi:ABC-type nitrate/sulfonate/bicarbonate transport system substrate-binding protein
MSARFRVNAVAWRRASTAALFGVILAFASIGATEPLRSAYTSIAVVYGPLWLIKETGLFKKYHIDATPRRFAELRFVPELAASGFIDVLCRDR